MTPKNRETHIDGGEPKNPLKNPPIERSETLQKQIDRKCQELENAKDKIVRQKIAEEIAELRREMNRVKQFTQIKDSKLREGANSLDAISAVNLLKIDKAQSTHRGEFLSKSFLYKQTTDTEGHIFSEATDARDLKAGDTIYVDFGKNRDANRRIGVGHMLPTSIEYVKVNGVIGVRSIVNNRVGYYTEPNARGYLAVFTGDTVTIPSQAEIAQFITKNNEKSLSSRPIKNTDQTATNDANDAYINRLENTSIDAVEVNRSARESYDFWIGKGLSHEQACGILANEFAESSLNPHARGDNGKAHGIFQWHPERRQTILARAQINISTASHQEQLEAAWWELQSQADGGNTLASLRQAKSAGEAAEIFVRQFERPSNIENEVRKRGQQAEAYAMLFDKNGRSTDLGDFVVRKGPIDLGANSCGAAVRDLLKKYGITGLPESNANGKNWENILDHRPDQFFKVKISHPREAYPGAILVYNGSGSRGSDMNQLYGHVEIKGSDGRYYSYYESSSPAGSAKTNESDPTKFVEQTGFIGYAYYPRQSSKQA